MARLVKVRLKRRREGKTDYKARLALLKSSLPRIVIRKTNRYIILQIVESKEARDFTHVYANSKELISLGWKFSCKNLSAAYLTGLILAKKALDKKIKKAILDTGLIPSTKGSRIYAALGGVIDAGLEVPHSKEIFPDEKRILGKHIPKNADEIAKNFEKIKNKIIGKIKK